MSRWVCLLVFAFRIATAAQSLPDKAHGPDCSGGWPTNMTFGYLKNAGVVENGQIDFSKTKTIRIASEETGKDLWHQVYLITFTKNSGDVVEAFAEHDASSEECSMTGVKVYLISKRLNPEGK